MNTQVVSRQMDTNVRSCAQAFQTASDRLVRATVRLHQAMEERIFAEGILEQALRDCDFGYRDSDEWKVAARQSYPALFEAVEEALETERLARTTVTLARINYDNVNVFLRLMELDKVG